MVEVKTLVPKNCTLYKFVLCRGIIHYPYVFYAYDVLHPSHLTIFINFHTILLLK